MATIKSFEVQGIVVSSVDYKESSKILKVFTRELGIVSVMARGAKRAKSKMQNLTSIFTLANFTLNRSKDFFYLEDGVILDLNIHLREDIKNIYAAQLCLELVNRSVVENEPQRDIFDLLAKSIRFLGISPNKHRLISMFLIKYISLMGYRPRLAQCVICSKKDMEKKGFSIEYGGICCIDHQIPYRYLEKNEYNYLLYLLYQRIDEVDDLDIVKINVDEKKINSMLLDFAQTKLEINRLMVFKAYQNFV